MTKEEAKKLMKLVDSSYYNPKTYTAQETEWQLSLWTDAFKDIPFELGFRVIADIIENEDRDFAPTLGHIKSKINKLMDTSLDVDDAWQLVKKSVQSWDAYESWKELPEEIQKVVSVSDIREWGMMSSDTFNSVVKAQFTKSFNRRKESYQELQRIPMNIRNMISAKKVEE